MASQNIETKYLALSANGTPIRVDGTDTTTPTQIHDPGVVTDEHVDACYIRVHNPTAGRITLYVLWNPVAGDATSLDKATLTFKIEAYGEVVVADGERMGLTHRASHVAIEMYVATTDVDELIVRGWVDRITQTGT